MRVTLDLLLERGEKIAEDRLNPYRVLPWYVLDGTVWACTTQGIINRGSVADVLNRFFSPSRGRFVLTVDRETLLNRFPF